MPCLRLAVSTPQWRCPANSPTDSDKGESRMSEKVSKPRLSQTFRVPIQHQKECHRFALTAQDTKTAATQALEIYQHLLAHGWTRTLQKFRSTTTGPRKEITIGEWLGSLLRMPGLDATLFAKHAQAIRQIARDYVGMGEESKRFIHDHFLRPIFPGGHE